MRWSRRRTSPASERVVHLEWRERARIGADWLGPALAVEGVTGVSMTDRASGLPVSVAGAPTVADPLRAICRRRRGTRREPTRCRRHAPAFFQANRYLLPTLVASVDASGRRGTGDRSLCWCRALRDCAGGAGARAGDGSRGRRGKRHGSLGQREAVRSASSRGASSRSKSSCVGCASPATARSSSIRRAPACHAPRSTACWRRARPGSSTFRATWRRWRATASDARRRLRPHAPRSLRFVPQHRAHRDAGGPDALTRSTTSRRVDERREERMKPAGAPEVLGVPLDAEAEGRGAMLGGFDDAVGRPGGARQARGRRP